MSSLSPRGVSCIACLFLATGCGSEPVEVGDAVLRLDVTKCYGTRCDAPPAPTTLEAPHELSTCATDDAPPLKPAWVTRLRYPVAAAAAANDDTLWVVSWKDASLALQRFGAAGDVLVDVDLGNPFEESTSASIQVGTTVELAVSSRGNAVIGVTQAMIDLDVGFDTTTRYVLLQVDDQGALLAEPMHVNGLAGTLRVGIGADESLLVAGAGEDGIAALARLDPRGASRWVQIAPAYADAAAVWSDTSGRTFAFGIAAADEPYRFEESLSLYDERGDLTWEVRPPTLQYKGAGPINGKVSHYEGGDSLLVGLTAGSRNEIESDIARGELLALKLNAQGEQVWAHRFADLETLEGRLSTDDDGNTYFATTPSSVLKLGPDGDCTDRPIALAPNGSPVVHVNSVYLSPRGTMFFRMLGIFIGAFEP